MHLSKNPLHLLIAVLLAAALLLLYEQARRRRKRRFRLSTANKADVEAKLRAKRANALD